MIVLFTTHVDGGAWLVRHEWEALAAAGWRGVWTEREDGRCPGAARKEFDSLDAATREWIALTGKDPGYPGHPFHLEPDTPDPFNDSAEGLMELVSHDRETRGERQHV